MSLDQVNAAPDKHKFVYLRMRVPTPPPAPGPPQAPAMPEAAAETWIDSMDEVMARLLAEADEMERKMNERLQRNPLLALMRDPVLDPE